MFSINELFPIEQLCKVTWWSPVFFFNPPERSLPRCSFEQLYEVADVLYSYSRRSSGYIHAFLKQTICLPQSYGINIIYRSAADIIAEQAEEICFGYAQILRKS